MKCLNINPDLAWGRNFDISKAVIPFDKQSIEELTSALAGVEVDPIGRITGEIPLMPSLQRQYEMAKANQLEFPGFCVFNGIKEHLDPDLWFNAYRIFATFIGEILGQDAA